MKTMKKISIILGAALSLISLNGCQKENNAPAAGSGAVFNVIANIQDTKTTLEGKKVEWAEGDQISIAIDDPAATEWKTGQTFTYSNGVFASSKATLSDGTYNFRVLYAPGQLSYNKNTETTYKLASTQTQDCSKPTDHIAQYDALAGWFTATAPVTQTVSVDMNHLCALMEVDVVNNTGADIVVSNLTITADQNIAGLYIVDYDADPIAIKFKESDPNNSSFKPSGSKTIKVEVNGGSLKNGETLPVYFVIAPQEKYTGNITLTVKDNVNEVSYEKTAAVSNVDFAMGTLNKTNYTLTTGTKMVIKTISEVHALTEEVTDGNLNIKNATLIALGKSTCAVKDATGMMLVYTAAPEGYEIGDKINLWSCKTSSYGDTPNCYRQISAATFENLGKDSGFSQPEPTILDAAGIDALNGSFVFGGYYQFDAKLNISGSYYNLSVAGSTAKPSLITPASTLESGSNYTITGYTLYMKSGYMYFIATDIVKGKSDDAISSVTSKTLAVGSEWTLEATAKSGLEVSYVSDTPAVATVDADGKVKAIAAGTAIITMSTAGNDEYKPAEATCTITVTAGAIVEKYYVKVTSAPEDWSGKYLLVYEAGNLAFKSSADNTTTAGVGMAGKGTGVTVVIGEGKILCDDSNKDEYITIAKVNGGYSIYTISKYYLYGKNATNGLQTDQTWSDNFANTISVTDGKAIINTVSTNVDLVINTSSGPFFRYYKQASISANTNQYIRPALYKLED